MAVLRCSRRRWMTGYIGMMPGRHVREKVLVGR